MSACAFSQKNSPKWIQSPDGDTLLGFNSAHVDALGEKLILKSYLVQRNYELVQLNDLCKARCDALASAVQYKDDQIAAIDYQIRMSEGKIEFLNNRIKEQEDRINRETRRKKFWKTLAIVEAPVVLIVGALALIL